MSLVPGAPHCPASQPVTILLNEDAGTIAMANDVRFRNFISIDAFKLYLTAEVLSAGAG